VDLDAPVEQRAEPAQTGGPPPVAQQAGADLGVGGVDRHEEGAQPLGQHPLEVHLGEPGEGGEVPVEEGQPVVVVLHRETAAHAFGQLMDEAELAVVVAGPDAVEDRRRDLDAEGFAGLLADRHREGVRHPATADDEVQFGLVHQEAVLDDVTGRATVEREELITGAESGQRGRRRGGDGDDLGRRRHPGRRHAPRLPAPTWASGGTRPGGRPRARTRSDGWVPVAWTP